MAGNRKNLIEQREELERLIENLTAVLPKHSCESAECLVVAAALVYIGDQLAYLNKTMDGIERNTGRIG